MKINGADITNYFEKNFCTGPVSHTKKMLNKKDMSLFKEVLKEMKLKPNEIVHVGDNPLTDFNIPSSFGIKYYLLDRSGEWYGENIIQTLSELKEIL